MLQIRSLFTTAAAFTFATLALACSSSDSTQDNPPATASLDASTADEPQPQDASNEASNDASPDTDSSAQPDAASKAAACASTFGKELTNSFGRIDGTVVAVVGTQDTKCALPNDDHVVVQVLMNGAVYRLVASVQSTWGDPKVGYLTKEAPLGEPAWAEGWHTDAKLDYVDTLGVHTGSFTPHPMLELEKIVADEIEIGSKISVYASSSGGSRADSAHLIHRNKPNMDGAIVVHPDSAAPKYLLFRFANQNF